MTPPLVSPIHHGTSIERRTQVLNIFVSIYLSMLSLFLWFGILSWFKSGGSPDFAHIYAEAKLVQRYPASEIYDLDKQAAVQRELFGDHLYGGKTMPFVQPPFTLFFLSPLGFLSFRQARLLWLGVNLLLLAFLPWAFSKWNPGLLRPHWLTLLLGVLSFYPFLVCLWQGQISLLLLWAIIGFLLLLRTGKDFWAGVALGLGLMRFHLIYLIVLLVFAKRRIQVTLGFFLSAGILLGSSFLWIGEKGYWNYLTLLKKMNQDQGALLVLPERFQNWVGQLFLLGLPTNYRTLASAVSVALALILLSAIWKQKWMPQEFMFGLRCGATLILAALASPYLFIHDLSIIFPALVFCVEYLLAEKRWGWEHCLVLIILLLSPVIWFASLSISQIIPIQGNVIWMSILIYFLMRLVRKSESFKISNSGLSST